MEFNHIPVLFDETISSLNIKPDGTYIDCTAGGGGHSSAIAQRLGKNGRLYCIDRDPDAVLNLKNRFSGEQNIKIIHGNFANIRSIAENAGIEGADGVLADLGVSSYQLDNTERGFSFHADAPLDMRMSKEGKSAFDVVNTYSERDLKRILFTYGEEKFSQNIARRIVAEREKKSIETTLELAEIIKSGIPARARREGGHPARRSFQAIRIEVNGEIENLAQNVEDMFSVLKAGGVLSIITFHSLEDRAVKQTFKKLASGCECPPDFPICVCGKTPSGEITLKGISPSDEELENNPRSRSARLRSIKRLK
ncbi:MAG: 16S rRNA (cytosine(1402)-N(4))-methyltransferase RsmH [Oscillospiraceae bacterium]|nr:16S rRNA (cytosine(1402)-N(4))-methyltransferase RsmH [Oscillospiraceae bacterium]